jgi:uncharacterized protein YebE (UPF0316 family)
MNLTTLFSPETGLWWALPTFIFVARVLDVTLGTLRMVFVSRGVRWLAPIIGFFEVLIWITVIAQIVRNLDHWLSYVAYAAGYGIGTWVGMRIEERIALGSALVRVIPQRDSSALADRLRGEGFGVTCIDAQGLQGPVTLLFMIVRRSDLPRALALVNAYNPRAFVTVEDVRSISEGYFRRRNGRRTAGKPARRTA